MLIDAEKLRRQMIQAGYTAKDLAKAANLSVSTIQRILNGKDNTPRINTICRLAYALNVPFDEIVAV